MTRLEEEDHEPVAVVRTLADFALALTLIVLMLVGTRAPAANPAASARASQPAPGTGSTDLVVMLTGGGQFLSLSPKASPSPVDAATLASQWAESGRGTNARIVLQFQAKTLASDLHHALLQLQNAFGANLNTILTSPALSK